MQPAGGGFRSGNDRFSDAVYRVGAWPAVQNICAASGDLARAFCIYSLRPRPGDNDLVDRAHERCWRDVPAIRIFGRSRAQISDLCRTF